MNISLSKEDYFTCLNFALKMWYSGSKSVIDYRSTGTRRDIGDYCTDFIGGKLAEIAFAKFLAENYDIEAGVDFSLYPGITAVDKSDLAWICQKGGKKKKPGIKIDVKGTKPTSKYFLVDAREFNNRPYDAYVMVLVDLPGDHLIRALRDYIPLPDDLKNEIKSLDVVDAKIAGFCWRSDLENEQNFYPSGTVMTDPEKPSRKLFKLKVDNVGFPIRSLRHSYKEWKSLVKALIKAK